MKIKKELGMALLFAMNAGFIILVICYNIYKHQWLNIPTNAILLLVSIYFLGYFLEIVLYKTNDRACRLIQATELAIASSKDTLNFSRSLVNQLSKHIETELDIVCEDDKYLPSYANSTDACMDLKLKIQEEETDSCFLKPNETKVFSTGIKVSVPEDHIMLIYPRSSTGFKLNCMLTNTTGIIDAGYRDEVKLAITNFGSETVCLKDAQRIAQFMIIPRPYITLNLVKDDEQFRNGDRGGGVGSTGE